MAVTVLGREILSCLAKLQDEMVSFLEKLVRAESPSLVPASQEVVLNLLMKSLKTLDYEVAIMPGHFSGGHLIAHPKYGVPEATQQLLLGHSDTVWPIGTLREMPFVIDGNIARGPGVYDMKGGLTQMLFALRVLKDLGLNPAIMPRILINSDEEIGSPESGAVIEKLAQKAKRVFVLEPSLGLAGKLKTARKGVGKFELVIRGKAAHAGLDPEKGISAILELGHQIRQLHIMNDYAKGITVNVGIVEGGLRSNVIAPRSFAEIDVRAPTTADARKIEEKILNLKPITPGVTVQVSGGMNRLPLERTPRNRKLWALAKTVGKDIGFELREGMAGGGSDGNITSQFAATLDGLGAVGDGAHANHEFVYIDKLIERSALLALLLMQPA